MFTVIVHGKPGKPGGVSASNLDSQSGKVIWTDGTIYGKEISSYRIDGRTNHNSTWVILADRVSYCAGYHTKMDKMVLFCMEYFYLLNDGSFIILTGSSSRRTE